MIDKFLAAWIPIGFTALGAAELAHHSWWSIPWLVGAAFAVAQQEEK